MVRFENEFLARKGQKVEVILKAHLENGINPKVYSLGVFQNQQEGLDFIEVVKPLILLDIQDPADKPECRTERAIDTRYSGTKRAN